MAKAKSRLQGLLARLLPVIDAAIPPVLARGDAEEVRRARILTGFIVVLVGLGIETSIVFRAGLPSPHLADRVDACMLGALALTWAAVAVLRSSGRIDLAANIVLAAALAVIVACLSVIGGIEAPLLHWVGVVPMLAVLLCGRKAAIGWGVVSAGMVAGFVGADAAGLDMGIPGDFTGELRPTLWLHKLVDTTSWTIMFLAVSLLYEHIRMTQTAVVAEKNRELETEIRQRTLAEERTRRLAYYDELTGLPNRSSFKQNLERAMYMAERKGRALAVMLLDLDGFKAVNDTLGHAFGDELLVEVGNRLKACTRQTDHVLRGDDEAVSRLGGDEFTILVESLNERHEAAHVARRVLEVLRDPVLIGGQEVYISASIGIAVHPGPSDTIDALLRSADMAMYHAKESGKNHFRFFEESMNDEVQRRTRLATELRRAIEEQEFELHYQAIIGARDGTIRGAEALLRWRHPERGLVLPMEFIPVAEETGLIVPIGGWVLDRACEQLASWEREGIAIGRLAVNVSAVQLRGGMLPEKVVEVVRRTHIDPSRIDLEITENAILADEVEANLCLRTMKALGVRVTLDDFGTGYSSLAYAKRFPVDALKIDRSFTSDPETDADACAISAAIVSMGSHLGLCTVGEGVETPEEARWLRDCGCDELQGHLFSPALPPDDFAAVARAGLDAGALASLKEGWGGDD